MENALRLQNATGEDGAQIFGDVEIDGEASDVDSKLVSAYPAVTSKCYFILSTAHHHCFFLIT